MKTLSIYLVSQALIALNAVVCWSWMFGLTIQRWDGVLAYVIGFTAIATAYNYVLNWERLREKPQMFLTMYSGSSVSLAAVDPSASDPGKPTPRDEASS